MGSMPLFSFFLYFQLMDFISIINDISSQILWITSNRIEYIFFIIMWNGNGKCTTESKSIHFINKCINETHFQCHWLAQWNTVVNILIKFVVVIKLNPIEQVQLGGKVDSSFFIFHCISKRGQDFRRMRKINSRELILTVPCISPYFQFTLWHRAYHYIF